MRITFLTTQLDFETGGGSNYNHLTKARELEKLGWEVQFVTVFSYKNKLGGFPFTVREESLNPRELNFFQFHRATTGLLKKYERETDCYLVDGHVFLFGAGRYRASGGKPTVAYFENYSFPTGLMSVPLGQRIKFALIKYLEKLIFSHWENKLDGFIAISKTVRDIYTARGLQKNKFAVIPSFIDFSVFEKNQEPFVCPNPHTFHVLFAGRLIEEKGVDVLLHALAELQGLDIGVDIVGDGPAKKGLAALAESLGVEQKVTWHMHTSHNKLAGMYKHAQVFVLPAVWAEPLGMVTFEAMYLGTPSVVSSHTGTAEYVTQGGMVFEQGNGRSLAKKLEALYADPTLRQRLSQGAEEQVKKFDPALLGNALHEVLTQACDNS